jgi:hypothetical protein
MSTLTAVTENLESLTKDSVTFITPHTLTHLEYKMLPEKALRKNKDFKVDLIVTLFDKVTKRILTYFKEKDSDTTFSVCLHRDVHQDYVNNEHLLDVLAYNVADCLRSKFHMDLYEVKDIIRDKLIGHNYALYVDKKTNGGKLPDLKVCFTLGVSSEEISKSSNFDESNYSWLDIDVIKDMASRIETDNSSDMVLTAICGLYYQGL